MKKLCFLIILFMVFSITPTYADALTKRSKSKKHIVKRSKKIVKKKPLKKKTLGSLVIFTGKGYGHGVGMTQYGAEGMAEKGYKYTSIIKYYYTGVDIIKYNTSNMNIRVALKLQTPNASFLSKKEYNIIDPSTNKVLFSLPENSITKISYADGSFIIKNSSGIGLPVTTSSPIDILATGSAIDISTAMVSSDTAAPNPVEATTTASSIALSTTTTGAISFKGQSYSGNIIISRSSADNNNMDIINVLNIEKYLRGVVPSEMFASWKPEALKAQALAARTYALKAILYGTKAEYDVYDNVMSQVYLGESAHRSNVDKLIEATSGQVITYKGSLIDAVFSASAGGYTVDSSFVWGYNIPYLKGKPDPYDKSVYASNWWTYKIKKTALNKIFSQVGSLQNIEVANKEFLRPETLKIIGSKHTITMDSYKFRSKLSYNIASAIFTF